VLDAALRCCAASRTRRAGALRRWCRTCGRPCARWRDRAAARRAARPGRAGHGVRARPRAAGARQPLDDGPLSSGQTSGRVRARGVGARQLEPELRRQRLQHALLVRHGQDVVAAGAGAQQTFAFGQYSARGRPSPRSARVRANAPCEPRRCPTSPRPRTPRAPHRRAPQRQRAAPGGRDAVGGQVASPGRPAVPRRAHRGGHAGRHGRRRRFLRVAPSALPWQHRYTINIELATRRR